LIEHINFRTIVKAADRARTTRSKPDTSLTVQTEEMVYGGLETGDIADTPLGARRRKLSGMPWKETSAMQQRKQFLLDWGDGRESRFQHEVGDWAMGLLAARP
jgi:hypothetical protein